MMLAPVTQAPPAHPASQRRTLSAIEWLNFFLADVQTGLGPFLAACLAASGWRASRVGFALTLAGLVTVGMQIPAGGIIDAVHRKRLLIGGGLAVLTAGALLLVGPLTPLRVYSAQVLIGGAGPFLAPTVTAITLGVVGAAAFDRQFGRNQAFNSAGNVITALVIAWISYHIGFRAIFILAAALTLPAVASLLAIDRSQIDYRRARGASSSDGSNRAEHLRLLARDRVLLAFLVCVFLFHLANAAMLPDLGEMLARGKTRDAGPFMAACIIVTQTVIALSATWIGRAAGTWGRKPLLLIGFGVLPVRGVLYTLVHGTVPLVAVQLLDGVANAIFGVVSILVIADRTRGTGRFNLAAGILATAVGIGAALSNTVGGELIEAVGFSASFLGLAAIAAVAFALVATIVPETRTTQAIEAPAAAR